MNSLDEALVLVLAMGAVILFCRAFPFIFSSKKKAFLGFVEKTAPPVAMTVLAFNALAGAFRENPGDGLLALTASVFTAILHLWKGNALISIIGGTVLYMVLRRVIV